MWRYTGKEQGGKGVYRNLNNFSLEETNNVIILIEEIYKKSNIQYGK